MENKEFDCYNLKNLSVPLPEDIQKLKWSGHFDTCLRVIERRLKNEKLPEALKSRLLLEKEIIARIPSQYPYSYEDALQMLKDNIQDFQEEELEELWEEDVCDWIYKEECSSGHPVSESPSAGHAPQDKVYFSERFLENLLKTRADYRARYLKDLEKDDTSLLDENIRIMKEKGCRKFHMNLKTVLSFSEETKKALKGKLISVYMPLPTKSRQLQNICEKAFDPKPVYVAETEHPQRTVLFQQAYDGTSDFMTEVSFDNITVYREPEEEDGLSQRSEAFKQQDRFLNEQLPHIRFTPYIRSLTAEVVGDETDLLKKAHKIYDYITSHVNYSFVRSYSTICDIPEYVASGLKGDCGFQALLFITMCRVAGVPARWQSGLYATPKEVGCHDWAEYYAAPYGWLFADCSFGGSAYRKGDMERNLFYRSNLDPYRIPYASEFQHAFAKEAPCRLRFDPYDNQQGEVIVDGKALLHDAYEVSYTLKIEEFD